MVSLESVTDFIKVTLRTLKRVVSFSKRIKIFRDSINISGLIVSFVSIIDPEGVRSGPADVSAVTNCD